MKICYIKLNKHKRISIRLLALMLSFVFVLIVCVGSHFARRDTVDAFELSDSYDGKLIIIDAGHGGEDPGAVSESGIFEKDLNLQYALKIGQILENNGFKVIYTRTDDRLLYKPEENIKGIRKISDLKNRCEVGKENPEAIFVSIHMNSYGSSKYSGLQVYYSEKNPESKTIAESVQNSVKLSMQQNNSRKIKQGKGIYLLENLDSRAILIECGFLTNKEECDRLCEKEYQNNLCFAIVCGIIEYAEENDFKKDMN